jgi:quercetin 2,3-dioxygenase
MGGSCVGVAQSVKIWGREQSRRLARFFVVGGVPFAEPLVMWWNFVARTGAEIAQAREDWIAGRFGEVRGYPGGPLAAPPLPPVPLKPR